MIMICDGHKEECNHDGCAHVVEHEYRKNCDVSCSRWIHGKFIKFNKCRKVNILDVDELFEEIEI